MGISKEEIYTLLKVEGIFQYIENVPFYIISDEDWKKITGNKLQPTQSYPLGEKSFAVSTESYFKTNDFYWLEHEVGHCNYYYSNPDICSEYLPYPDNPVERYAFNRQIFAMDSAGLDKEEIYNLLKKAYQTSEDWDRIPKLEQFLKEVVNDYFK